MAAAKLKVEVAVGGVGKGRISQASATNKQQRRVARLLLQRNPLQRVETDLLALAVVAVVVAAAEGSENVVLS